MACAMPDAPTIDGDLPCLECGYNLRSLASDGRCPECGLEVADSVVGSSEANDTAADVMLRIRRRPFEAVAGSIGYPVDAVMFVHDAMGAVLRGAGQPASDRRNHVTAADVCRAVREYAGWYFNDREEALDLLAEWNLRSSDDVGRVVYGMVKAGLMATSPQESPDDFHGVFTLDNLFGPRPA
jgi:uncharacterized repeat protein (TIGR04138 family)